MILEKKYNTKNLYISRIKFMGEDEIITKRKVFRGPFVKNGVKYYEMFPSMKPIYDYGSSDSIAQFYEFMPFSNLFPDLKKVTINEINSIVESLYQSDLIVGKVPVKKLNIM